MKTTAIAFLISASAFAAVPVIDADSVSVKQDGSRTVVISYKLEAASAGDTEPAIITADILTNGVRWISRTRNEDAMGMVLPATSEHLGRLYCQRNGQSKFLAKGETVKYHMVTGLLNVGEADKMVERIKALGF